MPNTSNRIVVDVASDRMSAYIRLGEGSELEGLSEEEILSALKEAQVAVDDQVARRVTEFIDLVTSDGAPPEQFLLAQTLS